MVKKIPRKQPAVIKQPEDQAGELADSVIDTVREPLIALDQDLRVVKVNRSFYETFKLKPDEAVGRHIYELGNKQLDIPRLRELLESIIPQTSTHNGYEIEYDFPAIGWRTLLINARQIPGLLGKETVTLLAIEDITERKLLEKALAEKADKALIVSEGEYRLLVENINDVLYTLDTRGNITYVSPVVERFTRYKVSDLTGKPFTSIIYPDDLPGVLDSYNRLMNGQLEPWEFRVLDKDGRIIYVRSSSQPIYKDGQIDGITGLMTDISERKKMDEILRARETQLSMIYDNVSDVIFVIGVEPDDQFRFISVNHRFTEATGLPEDRVIGKPAQEVIPEPAQALVFGKYKEAIRNRQPAHWEEVSVYPAGTKIGEITVAPVFDTDGNCTQLIGTVHDITERKQAEEAIRASERKFKSIIEHVTDIFYIQNANREIIYISPQTEKVLGYKTEEMQNGWQKYLTDNPMNRAGPEKSHLAFTTGEKQGPYLLEFMNRDGTKRLVEINESPLKNDKGEVIGIVGAARDITERKQAEESLKILSLRQEAILAAVPDILAEVDGNKIYTWANRAAIEFFGEGVVGKEASFYFEGEQETYDKVQPLFTGDENVIYVESWQRRRDGEKRLLAWWCRVLKDESGNVKGALSSARDITERKEAETLRAESEAKYRSLVETAGAGIATINLDGKFTFANARVCRWLNLSEADILGQPFANFLHPDDLPGLMEIFLNAVEGVTTSPTIEFRIISKDGQITWLYTNPTPTILDGKTVGFNAIMHDITDRKLADEAILRSKLLLQSVIDSTPDWMYVKDFQHKYLLVNKSFADSQNFAPQDMIGKADTEFFSEEICLGNPDKGIAGFHADDLQAFQGHLVHNPRNIFPWPDGSLHIYDTYKIPLTDQSGQIYGALVYSRDMTVQRKAEDDRESALRSLQKTMDSMISTMSRIVEMRDPYTAGHQQRVADLSGAIAREMKLDNSRIEHLVMAARIHDIGKMYIPSDILNKPGKLSDIELNLIRTHVQGSFDILQDIEFAQPVALMALQHHERLDGSGYPNGLKSGEIMMEAKILAVADVVEAMSSHRPYRPAPGIDKALEEISRNKGTLYDRAIVDTCLELFNSGKFEFKA